MPRFALHAGVFLLVGALSACSDWDAGVHGNIAVSNDPRQVADVDHTGLVWWETQGSPGADASAMDDAAEDAGASPDVASGTDEVLVVEILGSDTTDLDAFNEDATADTADGGLVAPDGLLDSSWIDTAGDGLDPCAGSNRPIGCACENSQSCASGLCVLGAAGLVCSPSCKNVTCPTGWTCTLPALVCKLLPDAVGADAATTDLGVEDASTSDSATEPLPDGQSADAIATEDASAADAYPTDTGYADAVTDDVALQDAAEPDIGVVDDATSDVALTDGGDAGTDQSDVFLPDGQLVDVITTDVNSDVGADIDTDGLTGLDWVGYADASFPDDADIYGGAINSCLSLYLYQQESCGKNNPTATCINDVASQGSLYANYLFEPVRACEDAFCVDLCATATDETCMNQCIGKNCPNQFLACVSNDQQGTADCKATFSCAMGYPGKLLTIGAKCYANGTLDAQLQVGGLISCETKPNTDSCFQAVGDCYDQGAAATNSCAQTITCTQNCGNNQECVWTCLGKASPTGRTAIDALGDCLVTICGPKCNGDKTCSDACLGTDCAPQFGACMAN